jgi:sugar lactone lactonase YvrE
LADGRILVADTSNHRIRRVELDGTITTVAGTGIGGFSGDGGPATIARLRFPSGVAALPDGRILIADTENHRIRRVELDGTITTIAGSGASGSSGDGGPAAIAAFQFPRGVAALSDGRVLIADTGNHRIRRIELNGTIFTIAGTGTPNFSGDGGPATIAALNRPEGVAALSDGRVLIVDTDHPPRWPGWHNHHHRRHRDRWLLG